VTFLKGGNGPALGLFAHEEFPVGEITLNPGDALFTFTDGVTEALDTQENLFSKERLFNEVNGLKDRSARGLVDGVFEAVRAFSIGAMQADDITMFAFTMGARDESQPIR